MLGNILLQTRVCNAPIMNKQNIAVLHLNYSKKQTPNVTWKSLMPFNMCLQCVELEKDNTFVLLEAKCRGLSDTA